jgi:outer membrane lipoprotein carrier protein
LRLFVRGYRLLVALLGLAAAMAAFAAGSTPLDAFLDGLKTFRASFTQTLVDSAGRVVDRSTGILVVQRPGKFSWETKPQAGNGSGEQLLVADGKNVWFYDRDLEQVTVKPADAALSSTPAMLLSSAGDVRGNFNVSSAGPRDGLDWVLVEPKGAEADFRRALLGFGKAGLARMIVDDKLGQTATIVFEGVTRNGAVAAEEVRFSAPTGVDVIGTPSP